MFSEYLVIPFVRGRQTSPFVPVFLLLSPVWACPSLLKGALRLCHDLSLQPGLFAFLHRGEVPHLETPGESFTFSCFAAIFF